MAHRTLGRMGRRVAAGLAVGMLAGVAPLVGTATAQLSTPRVESVTTDAEPARPLRWLALGDSYSSGEGVDPNHGDCAQSPDAYARAAHERLEAEGFPVGDLDFLACSGAQIHDAGESVDLVEQIAQAEGRYDLITLTIGGNDAGFSDVLTRCVLLFCEDEETLRRQVDAVRPALENVYQRLIDELLRPGGHIVVLGYPRIFEPVDRWHWSAIDSCEMVYSHDAEMLRRLVDRANLMIARAVSEHPDVMHFVGVANSFEGHNLCAGFQTTNEWLNGLSVGGLSNRFPGRPMHSFHPNAKGHAAEGELLAEAVKGLDWDRGCVDIPLRKGSAAVQCHIGSDEMDVTLSWEGSHHMAMAVNWKPTGWSDVNAADCLPSGGSKTWSWRPGAIGPGTYQVWIQGLGMDTPELSCDPGPYTLSVRIDGVEVWSIEDSVGELESKYYYVRLVR